MSNKTRQGGKPLLPAWFKICALVLIVLVVMKLSELQVFIQFELDGIPYRAGLTEIETYYVPLGLVLVYIILSWVWNRLFGAGNDKQDKQENG